VGIILAKKYSFKATETFYGNIAYLRIIILISEHKINSLLKSFCGYVVCRRVDNIMALLRILNIIRIDNRIKNVITFRLNFILFLLQNEWLNHTCLHSLIKFSITFLIPPFLVVISVESFRVHVLCTAFRKFVVLSLPN
jgi:hypothetical protein